MKISELADLAGTTVRTVRHYHHVGLLPVPENQGVRDYDFTHLARLLHVRWLVGSGMGLSEVQTAIGDDDQPLAQLAVDDLAATLNGIDRTITELTAQREKLVVMLESAREGRGASPLPAGLWEGYEVLQSAAPDEVSRQAIIRERELLEVACFSGLVPDWALAFATQTDGPALRASVENFTEFAQLPEMDEETFREAMPRLAREHLAWLQTFEPSISDFVAKARETWDDKTLVSEVIRWCDAAYPHPHHRAYLRHSIELMSDHFLGNQPAPAASVPATPAPTTPAPTTPAPTTPAPTTPAPTTPASSKPASSKKEHA
ncbi:MerR family transcriptional regulator [Luteococcus sp. Sow4_B9]|uniref:MerR family transcriptional regulator n=1 Tax=Luteococcus sp. Sow4_B9 TaxID=3438792 RepID=UPI003F9D43EB